MQVSASNSATGKLFDFSFSALTAYYQVGLLIGGVFCVALGGLLLGNWLYFRLRAEKVDGQIIGVRQRGTSYFPVYRYTLASGQSHEGNSTSGSSDPTPMTTGKIVPLLVMTDKPETAQEANNYLFNIVGTVLLALGIFLFYIALSAYPVTKMTWVALALFAVFGANKIRRSILPKGERVSMTAWQQKKNAEIMATPVQTLDQVMATPAGQTLAQTKIKSRNQARPVLAVLGPLLVIGGVYLGLQMLHLEHDGVRAPGKVVAMEYSGSSGDSKGTYHAVVSFAAQDGAAYQFKDKSGTNPPMYQAGEAVTVLYLVTTPQKSAIIDHGVWNWLVSGALCAFGIVLVWGALAMYRKPREEIG
jgi:hypothetical protein